MCQLIHDTAPLQIFIREVVAYRQLQQQNIMTLIGLVESDGGTLPSIALQHAKHPSGKMYLESNRASQHFLKIVSLSFFVL